MTTGSSFTTNSLLNIFFTFIPTIKFHQAPSVCRCVYVRVIYHKPSYELFRKTLSLKSVLKTRVEA